VYRNGGRDDEEADLRAQQARMSRALCLKRRAMVPRNAWEGIRRAEAL
jgi:hypothetical protein